MTEEATTEATSPEAASQEIDALLKDDSFRADFSGVNGHDAQVAAADRKRELHRSAFGPPPEAAPVLPERVQDALDDQSGINQAAGEAMTPATDPSEYRFTWEGAGDMDTADLKSLDDLARSACSAVSAPPAYAAATIAFVDQALAKAGPDAPVLSPDVLSEALDKMHGANATATVDNANAVLARMPEAERQWVRNALRRLDPSTAAWLTGRLSTLHKSQQPKA